MTAIFSDCWSMTQNRGENHLVRRLGTVAISHTTNTAHARWVPYAHALMFTFLAETELAKFCNIPHLHPASVTFCQGHVRGHVCACSYRKWLLVVEKQRRHSYCSWFHLLLHGLLCPVLRNARRWQDQRTRATRGSTRGPHCSYGLDVWSRCVVHASITGSGFQDCVC